LERELNQERLLVQQERQARAADTQRLQSLERELNQERLLVQQERQARAVDTQRLQSLERELNQERLLVQQERQARAVDTQRLHSLERELNQERQARAAEIASLNQQLQGVCEYLLARSSILTRKPSNPILDDDRPTNASLSSSSSLID